MSVSQLIKSMKNMETSSVSLIPFNPMESYPCTLFASPIIKNRKNLLGAPPFQYKCDTAHTNLKAMIMRFWSLKDNFCFLVEKSQRAICMRDVEILLFLGRQGLEECFVKVHHMVVGCMVCRFIVLFFCGLGV